MAQLIGISINDSRVVEFLKQEIKLKAVYRQILCREIVYREAEERGLVVTPEEIQTEADQFRYQHKLESASQTYDWLEDQLITTDDWEIGIQARLLSRKLAEYLFEEQVKTYFAQNKVKYEQAILYQIVVSHQPLAQELFYQITEDEISFFEAAHLYDLDDRRRLACGFAGQLSRWQLNPDVAARVFSAHPHEVIGVIKSEVGYELLMVEEFIAAELTSDIHQQILDQLFQEWLESKLNHTVS